VQSALLEAMQEYKVTIGDTTYDLERPFLVMATQNTIESLGVYDLPAAQLDRFLFKLVMRYPSFDEEKLILRRNITLNEFSEFQLRPVIGPREIGEMQALTKQVYVSSQVEDYIVRLIEATRQPAKYNLDTARYIEEGSSPRGSIALYIAAKAQALMSGSTFATPEHVKDVANDVLSHRIIINYEGQAEGIRQDKIVHEMLAKVPIS
jgi:MoxR-like ATPase